MVVQVYVGNLSSHTTQGEIRRVFQPYGYITSVAVTAATERPQTSSKMGPARPDRRGDPQPILMSILRGFACSALGMRSLSTPSLNAAALFAVSRSRLRVNARR